MHHLKLPINYSRLALPWHASQRAFIQPHDVRTKHQCHSLTTMLYFVWLRARKPGLFCPAQVRSPGILVFAHLQDPGIEPAIRNALRSGSAAVDLLTCDMNKHPLQACKVNTASCP